MNIIYQNFIDDLTKRNQTKLVAVIGKRGSGKSWTCLRLCEILSQDKFNLDKVVFDAKAFLSLINSGKLVQGDCILWDEMSLDQYSRDFMSLQNKLINHVLTVCRPLNIGIFFTCPSLNFVDIGVQRLTDILIEPFSINRKLERNWFKWKTVQIDPVKGNIKTPFPRIIDSQGVPSTVKKMWVKKSKWADEYEIIRKKFGLERSKDFERQILDEGKRTEHKKMSDDDLLKTPNVNWNNVYDIMARFQIGQARAYRLKRLHTPSS